MIITAKFASACPCCSQRIIPGSKVEWSKGSPAKHTACPQGPALAVSASPARRSPYRGVARGRWTGCSCGSRTDSAGDLVQSARNCQSCEFDA
jgi:hypothetical protein